jgi:hypothetical protein
MNNLGAVCAHAGQFGRAVPLLEETLRLRKAKLGLDNPDTLKTMINLGGCYRDTGRLPDAAALLEDVLDRARKQPGGFPTPLAPVLSALASTYDAGDQFTRGEPLHREYLERMENRFGPEAVQTADALAGLGGNLLKQEKPADAEVVLQRSLAIRASKQPDGWQTFATRSLLGGALAGQKKYAEAETLLQEGYDGLKQREVKLPPQEKARLGEAAERLVRLYEATGEQGKAAEWRRKREVQKETAKPD